MFTNVRLCKALLDRVTDSGCTYSKPASESYRFRRTLKSEKKTDKGMSSLGFTSRGLHFVPARVK